MRRRIATFIAIAQSILFLGHWVVYETLLHFWSAFFVPGSSALLWLRIGMAVLSVSFVGTTLLAFRSFAFPVRALYTIAAAWLGILNYSFFAACACWILYGVAVIAGLHVDPRQIALAMFGLALLISIYGMVNAAWTRVTRISVKLPSLPESWRGRVAALVSDTHLGHIRGRAFMARIVRTLDRLQPDVVFITGDMYDGTAVDANTMAEPLRELRPPLGSYFITGNHEEFYDPGKYVTAVQNAGVRVLKNEKVILDGLQLIGVFFGDSVNPEHFRSVLRGIGVERDQASILLLHAPDRVAVAAQEGISLQLSGHTHGGQFTPYTWITARVAGRYVHGLNRLDGLTIFTAWGSGTWGPPLRVGTKPEIVLITFE